jgi:hypothetical protein
MAFSQQEQIFQELRKLYFLPPHEIDEMLEKIKGLPEEALARFLEVIRETQQKQNSYLEDFGNANPSFLQELDASLKGSVSVLKAQHRILKNLN